MFFYSLISSLYSFRVGISIVPCNLFLIPTIP
nr:MAG TPA: hypothetical protein [Bacteriophage sp.]